MKKDVGIWIVVDYEENVVFTGNYKDAKEKYDKECSECLDDLSGENMGDSDIGLKVILAKVDSALNFYLESEEEDGQINTYWRHEEVSYE